MGNNCAPEPMPRSASDIERYLLGGRPPADELLLPEDLIAPCFGLSIVNLGATLARILNVEPGNMAPPLPEELWGDLVEGVRRVVWVIVDALGWQHLRQLLEEEDRLSLAHLARAGRFVPITSVLPTTTTAALISLWTGHAPAQHGMIGHMLFLRRLGQMADLLTFSIAGSGQRDNLLERGISLEDFVGVPGLAQVLAEQGIATRALIHGGLARTAFSRLCFRGAREVVRFDRGGHVGADARAVAPSPARARVAGRLPGRAGRHRPPSRPGQRIVAGGAAQPGLFPRTRVSGTPAARRAQGHTVGALRRPWTTGAAGRVNTAAGAP